jgi:hypothetical protein
VADCCGGSGRVYRFWLEAPTKGGSPGRSEMYSTSKFDCGFLLAPIELLDFLHSTFVGVFVINAFL